MQPIRFVVQTNLGGSDVDGFIDSIQKAGHEFYGILVVPFSNELPRFPIDDHPTFYYGSTTLISNIKHQLGQIGVFFDDKTFSMENYIEKWGKHMLNSDGEVLKFGEVLQKDLPEDEFYFIRPDDDSKIFDGRAMTFGEIKNWKKNIQIFDNKKLTENTRVLLSPALHIKKEWRNYIVDGKVSSSSLYRKDFKLTKSFDDIPEDMIEFVNERLKEYQPAEAFCMDVALCGDEYYIIECGCINSCGFYAADTDKIVEDLSNLVYRLQTDWNEDMKRRLAKLKIMFDKYHKKKKV